jgi:hypothetical protein
LYGFVGNSPLGYVDPYGEDFHVVGASGWLTPGPLGYLSGDTTLENLAAGGYNAIPEAGNILANLGSGLITALSALDDATRDVLTRLTGDPQLGDALNNAMAVTPIGWPEDAAKLGKLGKALAKVGEAAKCPKKTSKIDRAAFKAERRAFWKAEADRNPGSYSAADLERMNDGLPPIGPDSYPMELHHVDRTPEGGLDPMSRTDHRLGDNYNKNHP